jgi:hypothetical protein
VLVLLGIGLVLAARSTREETVAPQIGDHWHSAFTIYDCGVPVPGFSNGSGPDGVHTHQDSVIHIEPANSSATGTDAQLGVFLDAMGASFTPEQLESPEFAPIVASDGCDGEPSEIVAARWDIFAPGGPVMIGDVIRDGFHSIRFLENGQGITVARVPVGEDPPPPSQASIDGVSASIGQVASTIPPAGDMAPGGHDDADDGADDGHDG